MKLSNNDDIFDMLYVYMMNIIFFSVHWPSDIFKVIFTEIQLFWDSRSAVLLLCVSDYISFIFSNISDHFFRADNNVCNV